MKSSHQSECSNHHRTPVSLYRGTAVPWYRGTATRLSCVFTLFDSKSNSERGDIVLQLSHRSLGQIHIRDFILNDIVSYTKLKRSEVVLVLLGFGVDVSQDVDVREVDPESAEQCGHPDVQSQTGREDLMCDNQRILHFSELRDV